MMNLRPMEVRDNPAVAQLIRASLEEFGLDKPGTVYFDSHLDHLADYYQHQERAAYFVLEDEGHLVGCGGFAPVSDKIAELQKLYVTKNSRGKGYSPPASAGPAPAPPRGPPAERRRPADRKSTRLNSSHLVISYAVFCLKKKNRMPSSA